MIKIFIMESKIKDYKNNEINRKKMKKKKKK